MKQKTVNLTIDDIPLDIAMEYRVASDDLLLFLHGLGCSKDSFREVWNRQEFDEFSVLSIDLPGFGDSAKPTRFSYSMEDHARVCEALLTDFPERRLHVIAHSMGGAVGLLLSQGVLNASASFANLEGNLVSEDCALISRGAAEVPLDRFERELFPSFRSRFERYEGHLLSLKQTLPLAFYRSAQSLVSWSDSGALMDRFRSLECKKAYFYGERNIDMKVLSELSGIEKREIKKSGHFMMNDNPDEFYSTLRGFLPNPD